MEFSRFLFLYEIFLELARALVGLMRFEEAEAIYRRVLESDPKSIAAYLELGIVLERGNRLDRLADLLMMVDTAGVAAKDLTYLRALSMRREGKLTEALALAQEADRKSTSPN